MRDCANFPRCLYFQQNIIVGPKTIYRVFENEGQIEYGYKTLKFMVFDHEEDISVVYTSERFI